MTTNALRAAAVKKETSWENFPYKHSSHIHPFRYHTIRQFKTSVAKNHFVTFYELRQQLAPVTPTDSTTFPCRRGKKVFTGIILILILHLTTLENFFVYYFCQGQSKFLLKIQQLSSDKGGPNNIRKIIFPITNQCFKTLM